MCNSIHKEHWKIPKEGVGYKIFGVYMNHLTPMTSRTSRYIEDKDGFITWDTKIIYYGDGFCFFLSEDDAFNTMKKWSRTIWPSGWDKFIVEKIQ